MEARPTFSVYLYHLLIEFVVVGIYLSMVVPELREELVLGAAQRRAFLLSAVVTAFVAWLVSFGVIGLLLLGKSSGLQRTILALLVTLATLAAGTWVGYTISTNVPVAEATPTLPAESPFPTPLAASHTAEPAFTPTTTHTATPEPATSAATRLPPADTHGSSPTGTPMPTRPVIRAVAKGTLGDKEHHGLWVIIDGDPYARFLSFEEMGSKTPLWERGLGNCQEGEDILTVAASGWQDGILAVLSEEELCVVGQSLLWSIPISEIVPPQHQVQAMTLLDDLILVGTDFGLYYYNLANLAGGEVSLSDDEMSVPYGVTALDTGSEGVCLGAFHYLSAEPYQVWYSPDGLTWTSMGFPEDLPVSVLGLWCNGPEQGIAVLSDGRWFSLHASLPSNPNALGEATEVSFKWEGDQIAALVVEPEPSLCWANSESNGWRCPATFPPSCSRLLSLILGEVEGKSVIIVGCSEGIYYWMQENWLPVVLPEWR